MAAAFQMITAPDTTDDLIEDFCHEAQDEITTDEEDEVDLFDLYAQQEISRSTSPTSSSFEVVTEYYLDQENFEDDAGSCESSQPDHKRKSMFSSQTSKSDVLEKDSIINAREKDEDSEETR